VRRVILSVSWVDHLGERGPAMARATRRVAVLLLLGLASTAARAGGDDPANALGTCRQRLRTLAESVRARLDEADAGAARDAARRRAQADQVVAVSKAERAYQEAKIAAEVAEVAVKEYEEGTYKQELATAEGEIAIAGAEAKAAARRVEDARKRLDEARALVDRIATQRKTTASDVLAEYEGGRHLAAAEAGVESARYGEQKAAFGRVQAGAKKDILVNFMKEKRTNELKAAAALAMSRALALKAEWEWARDAGARLERSPAEPDDAWKLTEAEWKALAKFAALGPSWREILGRPQDAAGRDDRGRLVAEFDRSLAEAERAWSSARDARHDSLDAAVMARARR
jgi:hypothetical protein